MEDNYEERSQKKEGTKNPVELARPMRSPEPPKRKVTPSEETELPEAKSEPKEEEATKASTNESKKPGDQSFFDELN